MTDNEKVYKIIELVGSSSKNWEDAVQNAVNQAAKSLRDLRVVEVIKLDAKLDGSKIIAYRAKVKLSFKLE